jgi:hypothetical protein
MTCTTPGHSYLLAPFEEGGSTQLLEFIQKVPVAESSTELKTVVNGTTNEEVLAVLINRLNYLQGKFPCRENAIAITHIETALLWLNYRTSNRVERGVEGQHKA